MRTFAFHLLKSKHNPISQRASLLYNIPKAFASKKDLYGTLIILLKLIHRLL